MVLKSVISTCKMNTNKKQQKINQKNAILQIKDKEENYAGTHITTCWEVVSSINKDESKGEDNSN